MTESQILEKRIWNIFNMEDIKKSDVKEANSLIKNWKFLNNREEDDIYPLINDVLDNEIK